jgi:hypothetical protein
MVQEGNEGKKDNEAINSLVNRLSALSEPCISFLLLRTIVSIMLWNLSFRTCFGISIK